MTLLYISKHCYIKKNGLIYSTGSMGTEYFEKYLFNFDKVIVIGYLQDADPKNEKKIVGSPIQNTNSINFKLVKCKNNKISKNLTNKKLIRTVKEYLEESSFLVCKSASGVLLTTLYARMSKKPYMIEVVGCTWDALWNHSFIGKIIAPFYYILMKLLIYRAPFVTYVTKSFLQNRYPTKGYDVGISDVQIDEIINKRKRESSGKVLNIGTIGSLNVKYKGQKYVIDAIEKLKKEDNIIVKYHLLGSGSKEHLFKYAQKKGVSDLIIFEGTCSHSEVFNWLDSLDLYIQPSTVEGLPRSVIEAMSRGLPVIASNVGGLPELLDKNSLFKKKDSLSIYRMIKKIDNDALEKMSKRNLSVATYYTTAELKKERYIYYSKIKNIIK